MRELSIFVDESGHFDMTSKVSPFYLVSFVFHDQSEDISLLLNNIDSYLTNIGYPGHCVHTEPIIRSEGVYETMSQEDRHKLFNALVHFARKSPIRYKTFFYRKKQFADKIALITSMSRDVSLFCSEHANYFNSFDEVKLYYDNGQGEIALTLTSTFAAIMPHITFRKVIPRNYRFFQVADLLCTIRLIEEKFKENGHFSKSEEYFFRNHSVFRKNYLSAFDHLLFK